VFKRSKTKRALDRAATGTGITPVHAHFKINQWFP